MACRHASVFVYYLVEAVVIVGLWTEYTKVGVTLKNV